MKTISGIYQIRNTINGKKYIGSSVNIERRFKQHICYLRNKNKYENKYLQNDYNEYGLQAFKFEVIEECNVKLLECRELFYLDKYVWDILYNETKRVKASMRNKHHTPETKQRMSIAHTGLEASEQTRQRMSKSQTGLEASEQTKHNMSIAQIGHEVSEQTKQKMSNSHKGTSWINKDNIEKKVKPEDSQQYINTGWVLGRKKLGKYKKKNNK